MHKFLYRDRQNMTNIYGLYGFKCLPSCRGQLASRQAVFRVAGYTPGYAHATPNPPATPLHQLLRLPRYSVPRYSATPHSTPTTPQYQQSRTGMERDRIVRISRACESCRRRKSKCDGADPCRQCRAKRSPCRYRLKARTRVASGTQGLSAPVERAGSLDVDADPGVHADAPPEAPDGNDATSPGVYHSVAASHDAPQPTDSSQLFYGPSSTFAFLQQIHRGVLPSATKNAQHRGHDVQEAGPGLDAFMQRSIFFGTPLRVDVVASHYPLPYHQARSLLEHFKASSQQALPFLSHSALDDLLPALDGPWSQKKVVLLGVLAVGALSTPRTDLAEQLFIRAKQEAVIYEDAVTLPMIQFSLLAADYQNNIGRPNSAYLHIGQACRKALAMGLHTTATSGAFNNEELQERRRTIWCLHQLET